MSFLRWHLCGILSEEPKSLVEAFAEPAEAKGSDVVSLEIVSVQSSQQSAEQTSVSQGKQKILIGESISQYVLFGAD